jgi:molecular chaperone GrpE
MTTDPQTSQTEAEADGAAGPASAAAERPAPGGAEARELERQLDEARAQLRTAETRAQENFDRWQRAQADLANYRRRAQFEREELEKYAAAGLVASLLPVLDNFDRAWGSLPGQFRRLTWLDGVAMIHSQMRGTLQRVGLVEIEAEGQPFDPSLHEAVDSESGEGPPHVVAVLQAGYKLKERVIRPALVKVGPKESPKAEAPSPADPEAPVADAGEPGDAPDAGATAGRP